MRNYSWLEIRKENQRRKDELNLPYDPITGIGSPIQRFQLNFDERSHVLLPNSMRGIQSIEAILEAGSVKNLFGKNYSSYLGERLKKEIANLRFDHDFEFWAYTCVKIQDKENKSNIPFRLRRPQRRLLAKMEELRLTNNPIRVILLKARQWGGSTFVQIYMAWISLRLKTNWHYAICADVETQARNIRGMFTRLAKLFPQGIATITFKPYEGSSKVRIVKERGNIIGIGSMQNPDSLRSFDFSMLHLSEVGLWKKTEERSPEDLVQALRSTVPSVPYSVVVMESTAKGVGNFFHNEWRSAKRGDTGYVTFFVPWFEIEFYQKKLDDPKEFVKTMSDYEWTLWDKGATLEGIFWYRDFKWRENYSDWMMQSEYPSDDVEAFQSTGKRAFAPMYVAQARKSCRRPILIGELYADGQKGKLAFQNLHFEPSPGGCLWIWELPDPPVLSNQYCLFGDVGGRSLGADKSAIRVINRRPMMEGLPPRMSATWHGNLDQDLWAWKAAQIGWWYNKALLAIESNSLKKEQSEGDHFLTVLDEIGPFYPRLYTRSTPDEVKVGAPSRYGFHTNVQTKPMIIDRLNAALREEEYEETDERACDEMDTYEVKQDGTYGAVDGSNDDLVICTAGAVWLATSYRYIGAVRTIKKGHNPNKRIVSEASF